MKEKPVIFVIDGSIWARALYHGAKEEALMVPSSFVKRLEAIKKHFKPHAIACAFDLHNGEKTFRHEVMPEYKSKRTLPPDDLSRALQDVMELAAHHSAVLQAEGYEADDILATVAAQAKVGDYRMVLVSTDKDTNQLLCEGEVTILKRMRLDYGKIIDLEWLTAKQLEDAHGLCPDQWIDFQILVGDATDGITGAVGVGPKIAMDYLHRFGNIESLYNNLDELSEKQRESLEEFQSRIEAVRVCVTLRRNVPHVTDWI